MYRVASSTSIKMVWMEVTRTSWRDAMATQPLLLFGIEWGHLPSFASLIPTLEFVSFPSFCRPPISFCLLSPSPRFQVLEEISAHVFLKFWTIMEECFPLGNQDTNHNPRNVEMSNFSTCPSYTLCYLSLDFSMYWGVLESHVWHPSIKTQNGNTYDG